MSVLKARINGQWVPLNGSDEVHVGPSDPTIASTELWVDTDEPNVMTNDMRWNTSWGVVAIGSFAASAQGTVIPSGSVVTNPLVFTSVVGRRYRLRCAVRAIEAGGGVPSAMYSEVRRNGSPVGDQHHPSWTVLSTAYASITLEVLLTGDGTTATWDVAIKTSGSSSTSFRAYPDQSSSHFFIEDIGPVSTSVPMVNPTPAWLPMTLGSGWSNLAGGWPPAQYRKVGDMVQLRGMVTTAGSGIGVWNPIPAGYGPPAQIILSAPYAPPSGPHGAARCDCYPTYLNAVAPVNYLSLNGLSWSVTP